MAEDVVSRGHVTLPAPGLGHGGFHVEVAGCCSSTVVRAEGELDMASAPMLEAALTTVINGGPAAVAVDLSELTFLDSAGIRVLLTVDPTCRP